MARNKTIRTRSNHPGWKGHGEISGRYWKQVIANAKNRGLVFALKIEEAWTLFNTQEGKCAISGRKLSFAEHTASLDRIESSLGYYPGNIQWVHTDINYAKQSLTPSEFHRLCSDVVYNRRDHLDDDRWDRRFLDMSRFVSTFSKDPSTKVGAIITQENKLVSMGYNGFPPGIQDSKERLQNRETKYRFVVHAEVNAISNSNHSVCGCTIFTWPLAPCSECMKLIITNGIKRVVYPAASAELRARWGESLKFAEDMAKEAGLELQEITNG